MIKIKNDIDREKILYFNKMLRIKQKELFNTEEFYITKLTLYQVIKNKLLFQNFLFHPKILGKKSIYDMIKPPTDLEIEKILSRVILYETSKEIMDCKLEIEELNYVIKVYRKIKKKNDNREISASVIIPDNKRNTIKEKENNF